MRTPALLLLMAAACGGAGDPGDPEGRGEPPPVESPRAAPESAASAGAPTAARAAAQDGPPPVVLVDATIPPAIGGRDGWGYVRSAAADLDGDGEEERVVLTARVEMVRDRPAWDDGQPWQVYVQEPAGARTRVYARFLQLGTLDLRLTLGTADARPTIVLIEHLPDALAVYEVEYAAPDSIAARERFRRRLDPRGDLAGPRLP